MNSMRKTLISKIIQDIMKSYRHYISPFYYNSNKIHIEIIAILILMSEYHTHRLLPGTDCVGILMYQVSMIWS